MHLRPTTPTFSLYAAILRHFSSATRLPKLPSLSKIPSKYKPLAIEEAQKALTDYLHSTRSLPFTYAEQIGRNSIFSISHLVAKVQFSPATFLRSFQRFLRYNPVNEFEFFYESIGIDYNEIGGFLPANKFFLSEDLKSFNVACALSVFGFPWNRLGKLYKEEISIFSQDPKEVIEKLSAFKEHGFNSVMIVGICLVFPHVLSRESKFGGEVDALFGELRRILIDFDLVSYVEGNVDSWYDICRKIRFFYDLGCKKGMTWELMGSSKRIFLDYSEEVLVKKADFFCRMGFRKEDVGLLLLERQDILGFDLENPAISVLEFLSHFGMKTTELNSIAKKYAYVLGRNKMFNLPHVIRALNQQEWFFSNMKNGNHHLLGSYVIGNPDEDSDGDYKAGLDAIHSSRTRIHTLRKLNFLHGIGYGENSLTIKVLAHLHGTGSELEERFDCLLRNGFEFSKLCKMVSLSPKILNQSSENLEKKLIFLCQNMGSSLHYLDAFPAFLCFDLEKRIKPRYRFHMWLTEKGLCAKNYSLASMIATSEKNFIARISSIDPDAPRLWMEFLKSKSY